MEKDREKLIKLLDGADVFLRGRANAKPSPLTDYDIEIMLDIAQVCNDAAVMLRADLQKENELKNITVEKMDFSVRAYNCLKRAGINTAQDIVDRFDDLPHVRNLGEKCYNEVKEKINKYIESGERN